MRRILLALLVLAAMLAAGAQGNPLVLSKSMGAIKVTDPDRQLTAFTPILELVQGLAETKGEKNPIDLKAMHDGLAQVTKAPGVNATGDFWFVFMPAPAPAAAPNQPNEGPTVQAPPTMYILIPLADANAFSAVLNDKGGVGVVCGNYAIVSDFKTKVPYTEINFDVTLHTKRDIALVMPVQGKTYNMPAAGMQAAFIFAPLMELVQNFQRNVQQVDIGLAIADENISAEYFFIPMPGSALATSIAAPGDGNIALEYAGYFPANLAYCSAGGPMLNGTPGAARLLLEVGSGLLGMMLPPERSTAFGKSLHAVMNLCSQGRAIAITAPPASTPAPPTLLAVYHVTSLPGAKSAVRTFVNEVLKARHPSQEIDLTSLFNLEMKTDAEKILETPVDVMLITMNFGGAGTPWGDKKIPIECRFAYLDDKMCVVLGNDGKVQMTGLIDRIKQKKAVFTTSPRFTAFKATLPEGTRGFETYSSLDLARVAVNLFAQGKDKTDGLKWLSIFPPQRSYISTAQEVQDGLVRGEVRLPAEQLNYIFTLLKAAKEMKSTKPAAPAVP